MADNSDITHKRTQRRKSFEKVNFKTIRNKRLSKTNSYEQDKSSDDASSQVKHSYEWNIRVLKNDIREQITKPICHLRKSRSLVLGMEIGTQKDFSNCSKIELNYLFLWAAFLGNIEYAENLLNLGADINTITETGSLNALHLAAFNGSLECCQWLVANNCTFLSNDENLTPMHYAVLGGSLDVLRYFIEYRNGEIPNTVLNSAVRAGSLNCIELLISPEFNVDVNAYLKSKTSLHIAANMGSIPCMEALFNSNRIDVNLKTLNKGYTALHIAAENGYAECVEFLIKKGAKVDEINDKRQTPLYLASKLSYIDCLEVLLKNYASVNITDCDFKTPLHAALSKGSGSLAIIEKLVDWKADVNTVDRFGYSPLHMAAINGLEDCTNFLILNGANLIIQTEAGLTALSIIQRKIPNSLSKIQDRLTLSLSYNKEQSLKFCFREFLTYSSIGEIDYLHALATEGGNEILKHPLCRAFLYLKWQKVKPFYFIRMLCLFILVSLFSTYVVWFSESENGKNSSNCSFSASGNDIFSEPATCTILKYPILFLISLNLLLMLLRETVISTSMKDYFSKFYNLLEFTVIVSCTLICVLIVESYHSLFWMNFVGPPVVLLSWIYLTVNIGQLPLFGVYITMFKKVFEEFLKLILTYLCLLIGFTCTFCVLFPGTKNAFKNPISGFIKTIIMMTGELNMLEEVNELSQCSHALEYMALCILIIFVILVTIVLMNLLIGIAVQDVEGLRKTADLSKLEQQTELIHSLELICFNGYLAKLISKPLSKILKLSPNSYRVVVCVRPLNPQENRLPKDIMADALKLALNKRKIVKPDDISCRLDCIENKLEELKKLLESFEIDTFHSSNYQ